MSDNTVLFVVLLVVSSISLVVQIGAAIYIAVVWTFPDDIARLVARWRRK